jgi:membrane-associated phospholipid phosphatase
MSVSCFHRPAIARVAAAFLIAALLSPASDLAATTDAAAAAPAGAARPAATGPGFLHLTLVDLRDVLGAPLSWKNRQWELFSLSVAGIGAASLLDGRVRDAELRDHSHLADQVAKDFEPLGSTGAWGVLGSFYLAGLVRDDSRAKAVGEDGVLASVLAGGIIAPALKLAAGRRRPRDTTRTYDFKPFSSNQSFPAGHATEAFAVASVIAGHYDAWWVRDLSYGSAALVGFARIHHQGHFLSDVTAGALLGTAVGRAVVRRNDEERRRFTVAPLLGPRNQPGLAVVFSF